MAIPELVRRRAEQLIRTLSEERFPRPLWGDVRLEAAFRGNYVTVYEFHALHLPGLEGQGNKHFIAQFRYDPEGPCWRLYYCTPGGRWQLYPGTEPTLDLGRLIQALDDDPDGRFWH